MMHQTSKRMLAVLMSVLLVFTTACGGKEADNQENGETAGGEVAMGRYIQEEWKFPLEGTVSVASSAQMPDGKMLMILAPPISSEVEEVELLAYTVDENAKWEKVEASWLAEVNKDKSYLCDMAYDKAGTLHVLYYVENPALPGEDFKMPTPHVAKVQPDGTLQDINMAWKVMDRQGNVSAMLAGSQEMENDETDAPKEAGEPATEGAVQAGEKEETSLGSTGNESSSQEPAPKSEEAQAAPEGDEQEVQTKRRIVVDAEQMPYPQTIQVADNGDMLLSEPNVGSVRYGADGEFKTWYREESTSDGTVRYRSGVNTTFQTIGDTLVTVDVAQSGLIVYDYETGKEKERIPMGFSLNEDAYLTKDADDTLYLADKSGVYALSKGGSVWERLVEGDLTTLGLPSMNINAFVRDSGQGFIFLQSSGGAEVNISRLVYSATTPTRPTYELNVYALRENPTIRQAAVSYQRNHPEVRVNVQTVLSEEGSATVTDAVRALNTEILANKGPDIFVLDELPIDSYIEKEVLADLTDVIQPLADDGTLLKNIVAGNQKDGAIYAIPARVAVPVIWGREADLKEAASLEEVAKWSQSNPEKYALYSLKPSELVYQFYLSSAPAWFDQNNEFQQTVFADFLRNIKILADSETSDRTKQLSGADSEVKDFDGTNYQVLANELNMAGLFEAAFGNAAFYNQTVEGMPALMQAQALAKKMGGGSFALMPGQSKNVYQPAVMLGINANSKQQEFAKAFVLEVLSEDVQKIDLEDGMPINTKALSSYIKTNENVAMMISVNDNILEMPWPEEAFIKQFTDAMNQLETPSTIDPILLEMIVQETKPYFEGQVTVEEAVQKVAQRIQAYTME